MSYQSYERFEKTAKSLKDCVRAIEDGEFQDLGTTYEVQGLKELLELAEELLEYKDEITESIGEQRLYDESRHSNNLSTYKERFSDY